MPRITNHPFDIHVGARARELRKAKGISQTDVAKTLDISFQQLQKYENGQNRMSCSKAYEIANTLGVPVTALFEGYQAA